jgi:GcrA cell cycle regulator
MKERLVELWDSGITTAEIARRMNTSKNSVIGKAHRLFLKPRSSPIRRPAGWVPPPSPQPKVFVVTAVEPGKTLALPPILPKPKLVAAIKPVFVAPPAPAAPETPRRAEPGERHCQWLEGDPSRLAYCENHVGRATVYCDYHRSIVYVKVRTKQFA